MKRTLLIVDDIKSNREILKNMLGCEYIIIEAEHGKEALSVMKEQYRLISAVLLDLGMPVMDGYEVLASMRENKLLSQLPVIVTTGQTDTDSEERALNLGAKDYISKPYKSAIIRQRIRNTIILRETSATVNALQKDRLTGLLSRDAFFDKVSEIVRTSEPGHYIMSCFDIEKFKVINDQYGNDRGDEVLRHVAKVFMNGFYPNGGICSRIAADDFAVLYPSSFLDSAELGDIRHRSCNVPGLLAPISFSVGRYVINDTSMAPSAMYDRAVLAAASVKGRYDTKIAVYDESMRDKLIREQGIVTEMEAALRDRQFEIWYQPQYNHSSGALVGSEALVRWSHPEKGLLSPGVFVSVFEQNGFIYELDKYVWRGVCEYLRAETDAGNSPLPVSVNVSRYDMFREDFIESVTGLVEEYKLPTDLLRLEVTESAFSESAKGIVAVIKQLIAYGFTIEIDDFGSGYSSLNTLKSVPAQIVKMDMRFLEDNDDSGRGGNIIESVVRMAKWIGMSVIAEGVEEKSQADFLKSIGCNYIQGYLYAKPMPQNEYRELCLNAEKEEKLLTLETVENLDNNSFWNPKSMDTLIFNSYVGASCIYEYSNGRIELLRTTDKYAQMIENIGMTIDDAMKIDWMKYVDSESHSRIVRDLEKSISSKKEITAEYTFINLPGCPHEIYLRSSMRVIASTDDRYLVYCTTENITAQREAERNERQTSEQLKAVLSNVACGITAVTYDGEYVNYLIANDKYYQIIGYSRQEYKIEVGMRPFITVYRDDKIRVAEVINRVYKTGEQDTIEYRIKRRDGSVIWVRSNISMASFKGISEKVQVSTFVDITEQKNAIEKMRISEEENRLAMRHMETTVCRYDVVTHLLRLSGNSVKYFSLPDIIEDVPDSQVKNGLISAETADVYKAFYQSIISGDETGSVVFQRMSNDGWRWIEGHFTTIYSDNGEPVSAVISFSDITIQIEKESAYKRWKQSYLSKDPHTYKLFRYNLTTGVYTNEGEGLLLRFNTNPEDYSFDEYTKKYISEYVWDDDIERFSAIMKTDALLSSFYQGKQSVETEYREKLSSGEYRWLQLKIDMVELTGSSDIEAYLLFEDIDEEKRTKLATIEQAKNDPLTGVMNRSTFMSQVNEILNTSKPGVQNALMMVDIDGFKRVNDVFGHGIGDKYLVDIAEKLSSELHDSDMIGRLGGDEFVVFLPDIQGDYIVTEKARQICALMRRAFSTEVEISGSIGIAITPRDGNDFDVLYKKADCALYHVKGSGKDSYAFYRDDMADEHLALNESQVSDNTSSIPRKKRRMLIVDDSRIDHALMTAIFAEDFIVEKAKDGNAALIRLHHYGSAISVVLLDLVMPVMDGFTVLKRMQESNELQNIPVIVVTGDDNRETGLRAIRAGAVDFVNKPVDADILRIRVESAISKADNARLHAKNSILEYQNSEITRYKIALDASGAVVIENDWVAGTFIYDSNITKHLDGKYDNRGLWHILLSDFVAETQTVQNMQRIVQEIASERTKKSGEITVRLRTPQKVYHLFRMSIFKIMNDFGLAGKIFITLIDIDDIDRKKNRDSN